MPKFNCEVSFDLSTSIEFDGDVEYSLDTSEVEEFENNSYFGGQEIDTSGGEVTFVIEAEDEDDAERAAHDVVRDGNEVEDSSGINWVISNVSISVEKVEEPMTLERAIALLKTLFQRLADGGRVNEEESEAFAFLLDYIAAQAAQNAAQSVA